MSQRVAGQAAILAGITLVAIAPSMAEEHEFTQELLELGRSELAAIVREPVVIDAVRTQNARTGTLPQTEIDALDTQWRAEIDAGSGAQPLITETMSNAASQYLASVQDGTEGVYTEMFVMDAVGLNVAQSTVTSDYWQGDEAKWQDSFGQGADAIHVSEIEYDESSQVFQSQVSLPVVDPDTGAPIGAITVGINLWYLE
ncbi:hypothetical protein [Pelagibacterium xiamenense]|uniref:hypothetical protein n=1 Tax=Pelagibacterium xiamenense TaxID=2901140 RepID=UPI001E5E6DC7|nr:hypothetical protein [Pelagibacterium xiamenense]MCD7061459.1 hypothetical protein [Pelagibacterium xiamenense]